MIYDNIVKIETTYTITEISFGKIAKNISLFKKPIYQIELDEDKVNDMVNNYYGSPDMWAFKKNIVLAIVNNSIYILDGQHRIEMAVNLYNNFNIDNTLYFYYYNIKSNENMRKLFISINMDSYKNHKYINFPELEKTKYDEFKNILTEKYDRYFAKTKTTRNTLYTLSEFLEKLNGNYDLEDLINANKLYNKLLYYKSLFLEDSDRFYKDEKEILSRDDYYTFAFINNNFIDFYLHNHTPEHFKFKKVKSKISDKLRKQVWTKEFGNNLSGQCPISKCINILKFDKNGFHCGHIISEYNGGSTSIDNLRPICAECNCKMNKHNWDDYECKLSLKQKII